METSNKLATILNRYLTRNKLDIDKLSQFSGVSKQTILSWLEEDKTNLAEWKDLIKIANILNLNNDETDDLLTLMGCPTILTLYYMQLINNEREIMEEYTNTQSNTLHETVAMYQVSQPPPVIGVGKFKIDKQLEIQRLRAQLARLENDKDVPHSRALYLKSILKALQKIQPHAGTPSASVYAHTILHKIRELDECSPHDPILEILFAFYDALAFDGLWTTYTANQYAQAEAVLKRIVQLSTIKANDIEKAIFALDDIGFYTTPFPMSIANN